MFTLLGFLRLRLLELRAKTGASPVLPSAREFATGRLELERKVTRRLSVVVEELASCRKVRNILLQFSLQSGID